MTTYYCIGIQIHNIIPFRYFYLTILVPSTYTLVFIRIDVLMLMVYGVYE